jgi:sarcosine oxidase
MSDTADYDVIIVGLGAMGSAAAYHVASGGARVLGLDRFRPPHQLGSSHGRTRIIREAYFEHTLYVPLVQRALELWAELERESGRRLFLQTGGLMLGPPDGVLVKGATQSARDHQLAHRILSVGEVREQFPALEPTEAMQGVWEPRAGILFSELGIQTHLELAASRGATLRFDEPVLKWEVERNQVRVFTASACFRASYLLLSAGAWLDTLLSELKLPLSVERQVLCWFEPTTHCDRFRAGKLPIFIVEYARSRFFYGFPNLGDGVKLAIHHEGQTARPDFLQRDVRAQDEEAVRNLLIRFLPAANGPLLSAAVCMYTNTPDAHFIFGWHPNFPQVLIVSPCSGHGFKFATAIGELAATLISGKTPKFDLSLFSPERFV